MNKKKTKTKSNKIIPTQFDVLGGTYKVSIKDGLGFNEECYGRVNFAAQKVEIQPTDCHNYPLSKDFVEKVYCHELAHIILRESAEPDCDPPLHTRELFVDRVGSILHQILKSSKYPND